MVYAESVLLINFLVDGALLQVTGRLWGNPPPWRRWLWASALGAAGALIALSGPPWLSGWGMKTALPALMALICWPLSRRHLLSLAGTLLGVALLTGGGALALMLELRAHRMAGWAAALCGLFITLLLSAWTLVPRQLRPIRQSIRCRVAGTDFYAKYDTGNELRDPISGRPVMLVSPALAKRLFGANADFFEHPERAPSLRLIPGRSLSGNSLLAALPVKGLQLRLHGKWRPMPPLYAAVDQTLITQGPEAILPPLEGGITHDQLAAQTVPPLDPLDGPEGASFSHSLHRRQRYPAPPFKSG